MMSGCLPRICSRIPDRGHFLFPDANASNDLFALRARPVTLHPHMHLHFYIRDADADAGKCPTQPGKIENWMKKFGGGAELPAFL